LLRLIQDMPHFDGADPLAEALIWFREQGWMLNSGARGHVRRTLLARTRTTGRHGYEEQQPSQEWKVGLDQQCAPRHYSPGESAYRTSMGSETRRFLGRLERLGDQGRIAAALFRAQKASARAKKYRGSPKRRTYGKSYRDYAYERKGQQLKVLADLLNDGAGDISFGWGRDENMPMIPWVLYLDLPEGQVSFHSVSRFAGPSYQGKWDGSSLSESRVIAFCDNVIAQASESH
jgi:hypothetical protein